MLTEKIMVGDWTGLGKRVEFADPLPGDEERHQTPLGTLEDLLGSLPQWQDLFIPLPATTNDNNVCVLFPRSYRSDRSEQKFAVLFHRSEQSDQNAPHSFYPIRSLRSI